MKPLFIFLAMVAVLSFSNCTKEEGLPSKPTLLGPANQATEIDYNTVTLSWSKSINAKDYWMQVSTDQNYNILVENIESLGTTTFSLRSLSPATTYYWRVNAKNGSGSSGWTDTFQFSTKKINSPNLKAPVDKAATESQSQQIEWVEIPMANSYKVQISDQPDFSVIVKEACTSLTNITVERLQWKKTYHWRVKAIVQGFESEWSRAWSFTPSLAIPISGLILHMPFNGNANDISGSGNHGTISGGVLPTTDRKNALNGAYFFDGTGYIDIPTLNSFAYKPISYSVWVVVKSYFPLSPGSKFRAIIGRQFTGNATCGMIGFYADQNVLSGQIDNTFLYWMGAASTPDIPNSKTKPTIGEWVHLVFTQDASGKFSFYINGATTNTGSLSNVQNAVLPFRIGYCDNILSEKWNDKIDDVRVYNRVLTDQEIMALYLE